MKSDPALELVVDKPKEPDLLGRQTGQDPDAGLELAPDGKLEKRRGQKLAFRSQLGSSSSQKLTRVSQGDVFGFPRTQLHLLIDQSAAVGIKDLNADGNRGSERFQDGTGGILRGFRYGRTRC